MAATVHMPRFTKPSALPDRPRPRVPAVAGISVLVLSCVLSTAAAASAAPAMSDPASCTATLAAAASWPSTLADPSTQRSFSDAFYTYLLSQPACARPES